MELAWEGVISLYTHRATATLPESLDNVTHQVVATLQAYVHLPAMLDAITFIDYFQAPTVAAAHSHDSLSAVFG